LALHKTVAEIRALPYPEYYSWQLFYLLEPFGWADNEYRTAAVLAMLYNSNVTSANKAKSVKDFTRNPISVLMQELEKSEVAEMSRDDLIKRIKKDFGI
jgi:hypothetical protein